MIAVILNSGIGKRMGPHTQEKPKCMVTLHGKTILQRQLETLKACGITKVVMTTGPYEEMIINHVDAVSQGLEVLYVNNPLFASTNYIYSMHLAADALIKDDVLLLHGDIVISGALLADFLPEIGNVTNRAICFPDAPLPEKDFKAKVINGSINKIGIEFTGPDCMFLLPVYTFTKMSMKIWMDKISSFIDDGITKVYAENALNEITETVKIYPYAAKGLCMEIDTVEDLIEAESLLEST